MGTSENIIENVPLHLSPSNAVWSCPQSLVILMHHGLQCPYYTIVTTAYHFICAFNFLTFNALSLNV